MQKPVPSERHRTVPEIRQLLARFRRGCVSQLQFARNEGLCLITLRLYLRRLPGSDPGLPPGATRPLSVAFLEIESPGASRHLPAFAPNPQQQNPFHLTLAGGSVLKIPPGFCLRDAEFLLAPGGSLLLPMIAAGPATRVFVAFEPVDMRIGYDGLQGLVAHRLQSRVCKI
jgi:hypothetical protein